MKIDLDAIANRAGCDVSSLRLAQPLLEQGYTPPFLTRYRRDELGGVDENSLWTLSHAMRESRQLEAFREHLQALWERSTLADPSLKKAIETAATRRVLDRLSRRLKSEVSLNARLSDRLAARVLNPIKGDGGDLERLANVLAEEQQTEESKTSAAGPVASSSPAESIESAESSEPAESSQAALGLAESEQVSGPTKAEDTEDRGQKANGSRDKDTVAYALEQLDSRLANRMAGDPRLISAAVRWLGRNAKIHIMEVHDPHGQSQDQAPESSDASESQVEPPVATEETVSEAEVTELASAESAGDQLAATATAQDAPMEAAAPESSMSNPEGDEPSAGTNVEAATVVEPEVVSKSASDSEQPAVESEESGGEGSLSLESETVAAIAGTEPSATEPTAAGPTGGDATESKKQVAKKAAPKKGKKISPRQRRRRWLVSVLKPLAGKKLNVNKLSSFQIVMLSRALRSQVAKCSFEYDAVKLVKELQRVAGGLNRPHSEHLEKLVADHEATLREAAESAWWDELQEQASGRLVNITADRLCQQLDRGGVNARVVLSIDAIGPRTAAATVVGADGHLIHCEDVPCQLSANMRSLTVAKIGELIHAHHIDLIVISNGPARRACMIALGEVIKQSGEGAIRWTIADRNGADAYAGSTAGDQEMRSTPRRFRAAAWIAFSALAPSQALVKVDPLKLRLSSFQRELSEDALSDALEDIMVGGAARGGVDANSTSTAWMARLPGMTLDAAQAIDDRRRKELLASRSDLASAIEWPNAISQRQALPFLRVFGSEETLDGTLVHPDDYALAKKLAKSLSIELPPDRPPAYQMPDYRTAAEPQTAAATGSEDTSVATDSDSEVVSEETETATIEVTAEDQRSDGNPLNPEEPSAEVAASEPVVETSSNSDASEADNASQEDTTPQAQATEAQATEEPATESAVVASIRHPKPKSVAINKLVKEWQIGRNRAHQIVSWLCDPFGEANASGSAHTVMTRMPVLSDLKQGDQVIGVVVGVMPFGVFVELSPECSGLIHVSKISDRYVEDLHEAVQVGDVVSSWVTGIDNKRRRVALSVLSPEREAELEAQKAAQRGHRGRGGPRGGNRNEGAARGRAQRGDGSRAGASSGSQESSQRQGGARSGKTSASRSGSGGNRGGKPGGRPEGRRDGGSRGAGGGRRRDGRPRRGGERPVESYSVVGKEVDAPKLTEAMQKGDEPIRSFGALMELYTQERSEPPAKVVPSAADAKNAEPEVEAVPRIQETSPVTEPDATTAETPVDAATSSTSDKTPTQETGGEATSEEPTS
ncbi:MAG: S1 RNA-binding domain-containing protein [Planctomycetota bacterium]